MGRQEREGREWGGCVCEVERREGMRGCGGGKNGGKKGNR